MYTCKKSYQNNVTEVKDGYQVDVLVLGFTVHTIGSADHSNIVIVRARAKPPASVAAVFNHLIFCRTVQVVQPDCPC